MALNGTTMGQAVAAAVLASAPSDDSPVSESQLEAVWIAACTEIVNHITANGVVNPGSFQDAEMRPITGTGTIS